MISRGPEGSQFSVPNIRIYTTSYCGFCRLAKRFLQEKGLPFEEIDVTGDPAARARLVEWTGRATVPQVFIDERPVGGYTDLLSLEREGALRQLLEGPGTRED